jgi:phosphate starvation-inducible membrane PsiE
MAKPKAVAIGINHQKTMLILLNNASLFLKFWLNKHCLFVELVLKYNNENPNPNKKIRYFFILFKFIALIINSQT